MSKIGSSPFTPGSPVSYDLFKGRAEQIAMILRYVNQSLSGKQENVFLLGDRGIGKSSLASFLRYLVTKKENLLGIHTFLGGVHSLDEMVRCIFDELLNTLSGQPGFDDVLKLLGKHVMEVGLFGIKLSFRPPQKDLQELVRHFPEALVELLDKIKDRQRGFFIVLDDINGLAEKEEFSHWYKSFVDKSATKFQDFPVFIMLIGLPERRYEMSQNQPSLARVFSIIKIEKMSDEEVTEFFFETFVRVGLEVDDDAMELIVHYSCGLPLLMHEIGDATFWANEDDTIDRFDAASGVLDAAKNIGAKYLDTKVLNAIRSPHYRTILRKLGEYAGGKSECFSKNDVENKLTTIEKKVFSNFLKRMKILGLIKADLEKGPGCYKFVNRMFPLYFYLKSQKEKDTESSSE